MSDHITFIGNPGPDIKAMLSVIKEAGLSARRIESAEHAVSILEREPPCALFLDAKQENLQAFLQEFRENRVLFAVPVLLRVEAMDALLLGNAYRWGVDDFIVDGYNMSQFSAFVAAVGNKDSWNAVRAPAGQVILAHPDRRDRVEIGRILKRNGFDTFFAGSAEELTAAIREKNARAVIVSCDIPGKPVAEMLLESHREQDELPPFVLAVGPDKIEEISKKIPDGMSVRLFETGSDPEGITFVLNELLAPPPVGTRRSERVLWGTPVSFIHRGGTGRMSGFSFNINLGGLYIRTLTSLPLQTKIELSFRPPYGRGLVLADAQVVWRKRLGDVSGAASPPGMGVQFLELWPADQAAHEVGYQKLVEQTAAGRSVTAPPPTQII